MDFSLLFLLVALGVFFVLALLGLVAAAIQLVRLGRSARAFQARINKEAVELRTKQERLNESLASFEKHRTALEQSLSSLGRESAKLSRLASELSTARSILSDPSRLLRLF